MAMAGEIVGTLITHIKARKAKFGLVFRGKCSMLLVPSKTFPVSLMLETPHYTLIKPPLKCIFVLRAVQWLLLAFQV